MKYYIVLLKEHKVTDVLRYDTESDWNQGKIWFEYDFKWNHPNYDEFQPVSIVNW